MENNENTSEVVEIGYSNNESSKPWYKRLWEVFDKEHGTSNLLMLLCTLLLSLIPPILLEYVHKAPCCIYLNKDVYLVLAALVLSSLQGVLVKCGEDVIRTILFTTGCIASTVCIIIYVLLFLGVPEIIAQLQYLRALLILLLIVSFLHPFATTFFINCNT